LVLTQDWVKEKKRHRKKMSFFDGKSYSKKWEYGIMGKREKRCGENEI
jgi:hypothetical protein